ncbi:DEAD/DEAH box helicase family protein [Tateyamaria sp. Alg231-49]|uniref:DEAD/DEAH box helicase family protein n=1 Tax=Tateyamaria sp. Alg231-49 TaxID=1922219 RepID=UPI000D55AE5D|nr:DEAD/DEAH box helicase family protein [Tateyamaria sp. Alg231-49]
MPYDFTSTSVPAQEVQQRVSKLVKKAIKKSLPDGDKETWFFRSDTGTGKTTGFIQAIADSSNSFAIAVPTMVDVDSVYDDLFSLGVDVFRWHSNSGTEKKDGRGYRVVVGTHAFMLSEKDDPTRHIGDKDILIVDEVPSTARAKAVQHSDIVKAREYAEEYLSQELKDGFRNLEEWVQRRHGYAVDDGGNAAFHPIKVKHSPALLSAESEIVEIPNESAKRKLREVVEFLVAVSEQRAFERVMRGPKGHVMYYCWFAFPAYNFSKQIVFSATCHLDGLQFSPDGGKIVSEYCGFDVDYTNLTVWDVPYPVKEFPKAVSRFNLPDFEKAYDHVMAMVEHAALKNREIVVVCPKRMKESIAHKNDIPTSSETFTLHTYTRGDFLGCV